MFKRKHTVETAQAELDQLYEWHARLILKLTKLEDADPRKLEVRRALRSVGQRMKAVEDWIAEAGAEPIS